MKAKKDLVRFAPARFAATSLLAELRALYAGSPAAEEMLLEIQIQRVAEVKNVLERLEADQ